MLLHVWALQVGVELLSVALSVMLWFWPQPSSPWLSVSGLSGLGPPWHKIQTKISLKVQIVSLWARDCCSKLGMSCGERGEGWSTDLKPSLQRKQTEQNLLNWKSDEIFENVLIVSCGTVFMAENLITFPSPSPSQLSMSQGPGRYFMLTNEFWPPMFKHQTSRFQCDIQHNIAQAI